MTIHRPHPAPSQADPSDALIYDDCERCDQMANLIAIDPQRMNQLWDRMLAVELRDEEQARTRNEKQALRALYQIGLFLQRYLIADPWHPLSLLKALTEISLGKAKAPF